MDMSDSSGRDNMGNHSNVKGTLLNLQKVLTSPQLAESLLNKTLLIELYSSIYSYSIVNIFKNSVLQEYTLCLNTTILKVTYLPLYNTQYNIVWHGTIFVREGYYKDAIFKFQIEIPSEYPNKPPTVVFKSNVYHPLIDNLGALDLSKKFPVWELGKSFLVKVIYFIQDIFYNVTYLNNGEPTDKMIEEIERTTKLSLDNKMKNPENSSIMFSDFNKTHKMILDKILKQNTEVSTYDRIEDFKNWFMNNFMEIIQNSETSQMK